MLVLILKSFYSNEISNYITGAHTDGCPNDSSPEGEEPPGSALLSQACAAWQGPVRAPLPLLHPFHLLLTPAPPCIPCPGWDDREARRVSTPVILVPRYVGGEMSSQTRKKAPTGGSF